MFFQNSQNTAFLLIFYSARKKATAMVFLWGDRGYPAVRFEYKTTFERYLVAEIHKSVGVFEKKKENFNFFEDNG